MECHTHVHVPRSLVAACHSSDHRHGSRDCHHTAAASFVLNISHTPPTITEGILHVPHYIWIHLLLISSSAGCVVAQWHRDFSLNKDCVNNIRILSCRVKRWASIFYSPLLQFTQLYEYLAIDSGGYLCANTLCALIAAWLNASHRSEDGV